MELLIKERGSGKTTGLIYASEATGYPICVVFRSSIDYILEEARKLGCNIPQPVTVLELRNGCYRGSFKNVLFDEIGEILGAAVNEYLGVNVVCGTTTDYRRDRYKNVKKAL